MSQEEGSFERYWYSQGDRSNIEIAIGRTPEVDTLGMDDPGLTGAGQKAINE